MIRAIDQGLASHLPGLDDLTLDKFFPCLASTFSFALLERIRLQELNLYGKASYGFFHLFAKLPPPQPLQQARRWTS